MNIELDEVVVQAVSDDALELAAGGAQGDAVHVKPKCALLMAAAPNTKNKK